MNVLVQDVELSGRAVDRQLRGLSLSPKERSAVLDVLSDSPDQLKGLRDRLVARDNALP